ncbi:MAG: contractile injection system tape measure protein, partial [Bacteroidota bacterium]
TAVKNTSISGFQQTFLDRKGKVYWKEDKIELMVERKGVDVLLEKLPWSLSSFKLSWMEQAIFVEW